MFFKKKKSLEEIEFAQNKEVCNSVLLESQNLLKELNDFKNLPKEEKAKYDLNQLESFVTKHENLDQNLHKIMKLGIKWIKNIIL